jgi:hypothetical protein
MPINIYYMPGGGDRKWGALAGWMTQIPNPPTTDTGPYGMKILPTRIISWEVDGVPLGTITKTVRDSSGNRTSETYEEAITPWHVREEISSIKVTISDGIHSGSMEATPADVMQSYGTIPSNIVGGALAAYGTGKLSGMRVYNGLGLTPEYSWVSFKKGKYPNNAWDGDNALCAFKIYGYGTGNGDYNVWSWAACSLLETWWRPMESGETVCAFTRAGYAALGASNPVLQGFITNTAFRLAFMFDYGASVLWDKAAIGDGSEENPWVWDDGWQGAGYYLGAPGSFYGTATYISVEW